MTRTASTPSIPPTPTTIIPRVALSAALIMLVGAMVLSMFVPAVAKFTTLLFR